MTEHKGFTPETWKREGLYIVGPNTRVIMEVREHGAIWNKNEPAVIVRCRHGNCVCTEAWLKAWLERKGAETLAKRL